MTAQLVSDLALGFINLVQVVLLAWIGAQAHASGKERERRKEQERRLR